MKSPAKKAKPESSKTGSAHAPAASGSRTTTRVKTDPRSQSRTSSGTRTSSTRSASRTPKESAAHKVLAAELSSLIPNLDEEGLAFLIEQARVHLYNMEIDRQNAALQNTAAQEAAMEAVAPPNEPRSRRKTDRSADCLPGNQSARVGSTGPANFRIERSSSGSSYHLISGGKWKMYNEAEMLHMVQIASVPDSVPEVAARLHAWFKEERPDTFADLELGDSHDPHLRELVTFLRAKFAVKTR